MAFNLQAFGAGFAKKVTTDLDDERDRINRLADQEASIATQQRLAKKAEREAEQKLTEETGGLLMSLGYDENAVQSILSKGKMSANFWATAGQDALKKGVNPNTLYNMPNMDEPNFTETVESVEEEMAVPTGMGDIEEDATLKSAETLETSGDNSVAISSGFSINKDAFKNLYGTPDKEEASFGARLAVLSQRIARKPNDPNMESWKAEQQSLLADLATMKNAEREEKDGDQTPAFGLGTISANVKEIRSGAGKRFGFTVGIDGEIDNMIDGQQHLADIVELNIAGQLTIRNTDIQDKSMKYTAEGIRNSAISNLTDYGYNIYNNDKDKLQTATNNETFITNSENGAYRPGQVVTVGSKVIIYTGIADYKTGQKFIILNQNNTDM
tara:strand:- start:1516 stop:2670 length:1155 start_codon:yes stop_codon:yes gene_type:complete